MIITSMRMKTNTTSIVKMSIKMSPKKNMTSIVRMSIKKNLMITALMLTCGLGKKIFL
jgi:hypothetical protein